MQRAAYILPTLGDCYICKGHRYQHCWSAQPKPFLPSFLVSWNRVLPVVSEKCLPNLFAFSMSPSSYSPKWGDFQANITKLKSQRRTGIFSILVEKYCADWVTCWQLPGSLLSKSEACRFVADSHLITLDKHDTRWFCRVHSSLQAPRYYRYMSRWGKVSSNNFLEGIQLREESLCAKICLVTGGAVWTVQVLSQQKQILSHWSKVCMPQGQVIWVGFLSVVIEQLPCSVVYKWCQECLLGDAG